jgi:hypothetical protein
VPDVTDAIAADPGFSVRVPGSRIDRLGRWAPLSGVIFVVLVVTGGPLLLGSTPGSSATGRAVVAFYTAHRGRERAGAIVLALAFAAFLFFAATLRARWRGWQGAEGLSATLLVAAGVVVVGQTSDAGVAYALADAPGRLSPATAQTLNLLTNDLVLTSAVGFLAFGITSGIAIVRGVGLPRWLGFGAMLIGLLFVTPLEFVGFILLILWVLVVSALEFRRPSSDP